MAFPMSLCDQVVTLYRPRVGQILRHVTYAFYTWRDVWQEDRFEREFLLILPEDITLGPGDRVFPGVGPETVDWESFLPVSVPGLAQVRKAKCLRFQGKFHHWEASH